MRVHATAAIEIGAELASSATVGPFCVIGADVRIGPGVQIRSHATIEGPVELGEGASIGEGVVIRGRAVIGPRTSLFPYAVIGQVGQFPGHHAADGIVEIGSDATIREFVVVNKPVTGTATRVGRGCYLMARTQIDHDCVLESFVKTATGVTLGGGVHVEDHAYLGMNAVVHQGLRIGRACMIGMNGVVTAHVPPFTTLVNRRVTRVNAIGLRRLGVTETEIARIDAYYRSREAHTELDEPWAREIDDFLTRVAPAATARIALTP